MTPRPPEYLGDGVYLSNDGYQLWLSVGSRDSPVVLTLDWDTFCALVAHGQERFATMTAEEEK